VKGNRLPSWPSSLTGGRSSSQYTCGTENKKRRGPIFLISMTACIFSSQPDVGCAQDSGPAWVKLDTMSADQIDKAPELVQRALGETIAAYREQWKRAKPLLDRNGKPFPGRHNYIAPTIAWVQMHADEKTIGISLSDSNCDGPNSATAADLFICKAVISVQTGKDYRDRTVSVCYAGPGDESLNQIAYSKERKRLEYRVIIPEENTDYCSKSFEIE